jgi:hypothetical protein
MTTLTIDLQDGFAGDTVVVRVNGRDVFHKPGVNTDYSIGRADSVTTEVNDGATRVEILVPSRNLSGTETLNAAETPFLGISVADGGVVFKPARELFRYF